MNGISFCSVDGLREFAEHKCNLGDSVTPSRSFGSLDHFFKTSIERQPTLRCAGLFFGASLYLQEVLYETAILVTSIAISVLDILQAPFNSQGRENLKKDSLNTLKNFLYYPIAVGLIWPTFASLKSYSYMRGADYYYFCHHGGVPNWDVRYARREYEEPFTYDTIVITYDRENGCRHFRR